MKPLSALDGPMPRSPWQRGPLAASRCYCGGGGGGSSTSQAQSNDTSDSRVGVDGDGATVLKDSTVGDVTINTLDADVATSALDVAESLGRSAGQAAVDLAAESQFTARELGTVALSALDSYLAGQNRLISEAFDTARDVNANTLASAARLAEGSNTIAAAVSDSQRAFVETASGQKSAQVTIGLAIAGAAALAFILSPPANELPRFTSRTVSRYSGQPARYVPAGRC